MRLYNFKRLIKKYSVDFTLKTEAKGQYVGGKWEAGEPICRQMRGAIVPMSDRKIYQSGGTYTQQDRMLYLSEPLQGSLQAFKVIHGTNTYTVEESRDYSDYAAVGVYTLKRVDVNA